MAYTVEGNGDRGNEIDLTAANKDVKQYGVKYVKKFIATETVEKIIVFDPRRDKGLQVVANSETWTLEITTTTGEGNTDITHADVPWLLLKDQITDDFASGGGDINKGILAVRITSGSVAVPAALGDDFEIHSYQHEQNPKGE